MGLGHPVLCLRVTVPLLRNVAVHRNAADQRDPKIQLHLRIPVEQPSGHIDHIDSRDRFEQHFQFQAARLFVAGAQPVGPLPARLPFVSF